MLNVRAKRLMVVLYIYLVEPAVDLFNLSLVCGTFGLNVSVIGCETVGQKVISMTSVTIFASSDVCFDIH